MKKLVITIAIALVGLAPALSSATTPQQDLKQFRAFFFKRFPGVKLQRYADGVYGINAEHRKEYEALIAFPPYDPGLDLGKKLFKKFHVGRCFKNGGIAIRQHYPWFDTKTGKLHTLSMDVMTCLKRNHVDLKKNGLHYGKGKFATILAYMAYTSRGKKLNVVIPNDPRALAIYERGKRFFFMKRGQLNMSCADCHMYNSGDRARANILSPELGHPAHFPTYRKKWEATRNPVYGGFGTLEYRYVGCNKKMRAKPFKPQSPEYQALEYWATYMSNGIKVNGPDVRQ